MAYEQKDNSGSLFKNDRKQQPAQPDYTGKGIVNGKDVYISAWVKKAKSGMSFFSISFRNIEAEQPSFVNNQQPAQSQAEFPDLPF